MPSLNPGNRPLRGGGSLGRGKGSLANTGSLGRGEKNSLAPGSKELGRGQGMGGPQTKPQQTLNASKSLSTASTGLKQTGALERGDGELAKSTAKMSTQRKQSPGELRARRLIKDRSGGICEICGHRPATDAAHRLSRGVGGLWEAANLLHACRTCHSTNHDNPLRAYELGQHLRNGSDPLTAPVYLHRPVPGWYTIDNDGQRTEKN